MPTHQTTSLAQRLTTGSDNFNQIAILLISPADAAAATDATEQRPAPQLLVVAVWSTQNLMQNLLLRTSDAAILVSLPHSNLFSPFFPPIQSHQSTQMFADGALLDQVSWVAARGDWPTKWLAAFVRLWGALRANSQPIEGLRICARAEIRSRRRHLRWPQVSRSLVRNFFRQSVGRSVGQLAA